ncbi:MAG: cyclic nucleotide-binding [Chthonomonadaceae bacterium]|nr:cyclic nucleotide-binding [Chthonomonadaceae bacterium]
MTTILDRFTDAGGRRRLLALATGAKLMGGDEVLAARFVDAAEPVRLRVGDALIKEGGEDTDLYLILAGEVGIHVKGVQVNTRRAGDHVGEIAAIDPSQLRSATVTVEVEGVALKVPEPILAEIANETPVIWRRLALEQTQRLLQRNALLRPANDQPRVFMICSAEALNVARHIQAGLIHDDMLVVMWPDGVFRLADYPVESLEKALHASDFAIAVIHPDDTVTSRGVTTLSPRDNVTFELGMFMGTLGRDRSVIMEPSDKSIKLASDLRGLTTLSYRNGPEDDLEALLAPACLEIRKHVGRIGVRR